jgi:hypothetical protein
MLTIWPPLPIIIWGRKHYHSASNEDNIIAALEHPDRVCKVELNGVPSLLLEKLLASHVRAIPSAGISEARDQG